MTVPHSYTATEWLEHATKQLNSLHALFKANDWQPDCTLIEGLTTATGQINEAMQLLRSSGPSRDEVIEECAKVCDEYAADTEQRKNEERGYWTEEASAVFKAQKELARHIRELSRIATPSYTGEKK